MDKRQKTAMIVAATWSWSYIALAIVNLDWQWIANPHMDFTFLRFMWLTVCTFISVGFLGRHL